MGGLDFEDVVFGYGDARLFDGFSASFPKGKISCIVGPNECGKSTLAKLAMGLVRPASGRVLIAAMLHRCRLASGRAFWACWCNSRRRR